MKGFWWSAGVTALLTLIGWVTRDPGTLFFAFGWLIYAGLLLRYAQMEEEKKDGQDSG